MFYVYDGGEPLLKTFTENDNLNDHHHDQMTQYWSYVSSYSHVIKILAHSLNLLWV